MTSERHEQVSRLFLRCCELSPEERADLLRTECAVDPSMAEEVKAMLTADESDRRLPRSTGAPFDLGALPDAIDQKTPAWIGDYEVIERLGIGGMGVVYSAWQRDPRRRVALKVIRSGLVTTRVLRHFRREVELLARVQHSGIAQIFAAGRTHEDPPQPYFAMELVEGKPLVERVEELGLGLRPRIELFLQICRAVHHAHLKGVVHRDLKPSNVLVTEEGVAKVLDFGIAVTTEVDARTVAEGGATGFLGTVTYMSPEQARGEVAELDARSDVYSLGVMLFELLSRALPHDVEGKTFYHAMQLKADRPPRRLRDAWSRCPADLEAIVAKVLESDRERRYQSASEFAADLERFLNGHPVEARRLTPWYLAQKFASRHRLTVGLAVAAVLVLIAITLVSIDLERTSNRQLQTILDLKDSRVLMELEQLAEEDLWPRRPARVPRFDRWLEQAEALRSRLDLHRASILRLREELRTVPDEDREGLEWHLETLELLERHLTEFLAQGGTVDRVRAHRECAIEVIQATIDGPVAEDWDRARKDILDSPDYGGLDLQPQVGLVPLGIDPNSGLQEFWVWESGDRPERGPDDCVLPSESSGIVLTLIPGGRVWLGSSPLFRRGGVQESAWHSYDDGPVVPVVLDPFFVAKFELTVEQAATVFGGDLVPMDREGTDPNARSLCSIDWLEATLIAKRLGLSLPTDIQWDCACRARANLRGEDPVTAVEEWLPANPSRELPNRFGLHQTLSGVQEWTACAIGFPDQDLLREGDGARVVMDDPDRIIRGDRGDSRRCVELRHRLPVDTRSPYLGVRLARSIECGRKAAE